MHKRNIIYSCFVEFIRLSRAERGSSLGIQRFEHAVIRVKDQRRALSFYTEVLGLVEIGRQDGVTYLGCGMDQRYDIGIIEGGTGVEHFAIRVDDEQFLDDLQRNIEHHGIKTERTVGAEPGQGPALSFHLPSGHKMEFVVMEPAPYVRAIAPSLPQRAPHAPLDADHINLMTTDVERVSLFCRDVLGLSISDVTRVHDDLWAAAWLRYGGHHHDLAFLLHDDPSEGLHHFAWAMAGIEHMKIVIDRLAQAGFKVELGPGRHPVGSNLFLYFWEPGGNRFELSSEAAFLDPNTPTRYWSSMSDTLDAWGQVAVPDSFRRGS